jgi:hypothetical protein
MLKSSITEKSICQNEKIREFNRKEYEDILSGENVFIELYYQGKVIST